MIFDLRAMAKLILSLGLSKDFFFFFFFFSISMNSQGGGEEDWDKQSSGQYPKFFLAVGGWSDDIRMSMKCVLSSIKLWKLTEITVWSENVRLRFCDVGICFMALNEEHSVVSPFVGWISLLCLVADTKVITVISGWYLPLGIVIGKKEAGGGWQKYRVTPDFYQVKPGCLLL